MLRFLVVFACLVLVDGCSAGDTCANRCLKDKACQDAIVAEGIAPAGGLDSGLCNGICSALRNTAREDKKLQAELGLAPTEVTHPCLPSKAKKPAPPSVGSAPAP